MDLGLKGKSILVTGGSKGIGLAIAQARGKRGGQCRDLRAQLRRGGRRRQGARRQGRQVMGQGDRCRRPRGIEGLDRGRGRAVRRHRCAGVQCQRACRSATRTETWEKSFRTDMMHTVNAVGAAEPYLEKSESASVIIVSSVSGFEVDFAAGSYGAIKAALIHYAKGLAHKLVGKGIRVNACRPATPISKAASGRTSKRACPICSRPRCRSIRPAGWARRRRSRTGVVFLASPLASRISGTNLIIDGALTKAVDLPPARRLASMPASAACARTCRGSGDALAARQEHTNMMYGRPTQPNLRMYLPIMHL